MKLEVDWERCVGHGKCYLSAPHLFSPHPEDDWGKPIVLVPDIDPADEALLASAVMSTKLCPEFAITLDGVAGA
ncbi:MAG: ferredoxin [Sporichthyaceae bacterium]